MKTHTPGPWTVTGNNGLFIEPICMRAHYNFLGDRCRKCNVQKIDHITDSSQVYNPRKLEEAQANARLIAAAPDLLAACRAARDWYGLDGDGISEPVLSQLKAAIYAAEASG